MAKVGTPLGRWVKHSTDSVDGSPTRTHYALRSDGKVVKKSSVLLGNTGDGRDKGRWHDWGWKRVTLKGSPSTVADVDALLTPHGYVRD